MFRFVKSFIEDATQHSSVPLARPMADELDDVKAGRKGYLEKCSKEQKNKEKDNKNLPLIILFIKRGLMLLKCPRYIHIIVSN